MKKDTYICDRCGEQTIPNEKQLKHWGKLLAKDKNTYKLGDWKEECVSFYCNTPVGVDICPACMDAFKRWWGNT